MILSQFTIWPQAGGILDQDPLFIRRLEIYTAAKNVQDRREKAENDRKRPKGKGG